MGEKTDEQKNRTPQYFRARDRGRQNECGCTSACVLEGKRIKHVDPPIGEQAHPSNPVSGDKCLRKVHSPGESEPALMAPRISHSSY